MSCRDFRCAFSGVSLLNAEVAVVLLQESGTIWVPVALPLFGVYEGLGTVGEVNDGPNADLILAWFQAGIEAGQVHVGFDALGIPPQPIDHIETLLSVVACSQLQGQGSVWTVSPSTQREGALGFALLSAHVAATLMEDEPTLRPEVQVEDLPQVVFDSDLGHLIYQPLRHQTHRLRCKFGLSMVGLAALSQGMSAHNRPWGPPGDGILLAESEPALWLAQAMVEFAESPSLIEALEDYAGQGEDEL